MGTSYVEIYKRALGTIKSYRFAQLPKDDSITLYLMLFPFLQNAFGRITEPLELVEILQYRKEPDYQEDDFVGDGFKNSFALNFDVEVNSLDNVYFDVILDNARLIEGVDYVYNPITNSIDFTEIPTQESNINIIYYFVGEILGTDSKTLQVKLKDHSLRLLASYVTLGWIEKNKNRELNIEANLGAKHSPANALKEIRELYTQALDEVQNSQNAFGWTTKFLKAKNSKINLIAEITPKL